MRQFRIFMPSITILILFLTSCADDGEYSCEVIHHDLVKSVATLTELQGSEEELTIGMVHKHGEFFVELAVGTPPQIVHAVFDTGSAKLVLAGPNCSGCTGNTHYNPSASSTNSGGDEKVTLHYGSGSGSGVYYSDSVSMNECNEYVPQEIVVLSQAKSLSNVMGVAPGDGSSYIETVHAIDGIKDVFSVRLCQAGGGFLRIGENSLNNPKYTKYNVAESTWFPIIGQSVHVGEDFWTAQAEEMIVDTGTTLLLLNREIIDNTFSKALHGSVEQHGSQEAKDALSFLTNYPTNSAQVTKHTFSRSIRDELVGFLPPILLNLKGESGQDVALSLDASAYIIPWDGNFIIGVGETDEFAAIIGQTMLEQYNVVFDLKNQRIGWEKSSCAVQ